MLIIEKILPNVNLNQDSSLGNFFLDIFSENDKIVLMET
ncbi:hypothetical protein HMPREF1115_0340 [Streptococcus oralis SK610]|uniref:Uncharacterized protein n=1 Tax=Streptococcus oralis SK610 TaxID=1095741 RepID=I0Q4M7_STROR|nr:hypothetical protein HMPREF1115_0340 [Streptococcus oralis SK610]